MDAIPQMNETLQEMIDHHLIRKLLAVYCHGCDRGDGPRMASVYSNTAVDNHGAYNGPGKPFADFVMQMYLDTKIKCTHILGQSLINVNGDDAGSETYFIAHIADPGEDGHETTNIMGGRYVDTLRRENGQWLIANRLCVRDWSLSLDFEKDALAKNSFIQGQLAFIQGQQSGQDVSYAALGLKHPGLPAGA